ncbi:MAG: hypothetical protein AB7F88_08470 [Pyrinomonadaceae bacterium]
MSDAVLSQIENSILSLTTDQQRQLLLRLSDKLRRDPAVTSDFESELATMAMDEDIQREIAEIALDFRSAEFDGLAE